jgi:hypothetical protein
VSFDSAPICRTSSILVSVIVGKEVIEVGVVVVIH